MNHLITGISPNAVKAGNHRFSIDGEVASIYGGAVHYWRLDRARWNDILETVKGMGFTMISVYIPWVVHEIEKGKFDFGKGIRAMISMHSSLWSKKGDSISLYVQARRSIRS